jgi:L-threonylcarbamoyladenylate synthase
MERLNSSHISLPLHPYISIVFPATVIYYRQEKDFPQRIMLESFSPEIHTQIEKGISILKKGGTVAFPTDTIYGLGACANGEKAVARIYQIKERLQTMALPLLVAETSQLHEVTAHIPPAAWLLAKKFWPGALTIVFHRSRSVLDIVTGGGNTVGVRIPAHPIPIALARGAGPLVGTSANLSGKQSNLTADGVRSQLGDRIDFIIDGGQCPGGRESTIVDVTRETPVVLREGAISIEELRHVCEIVKP